MKTTQTYLAAILLAASSSSYLGAVGSRIAYQDAFATARGNAFVATADSASAVFYNPAGLTQLEGTQIKSNVYAFSANHSFNTGPVSESTDEGFQPLPNFFAAHNFDNIPIAVGFGVYAPFALGVDWGRNSAFAPLGYQSDLSYVKSGVVLAWQVTDTLSVGIGTSYDQGDITLKTTGPLGDFEGDDETIGFTASLLWQPNEHHSFGASYQHGTELTFSGRQTNFIIPVPVPTPATTDATAKLDFPESVILGYSWRPNEKWNIEANIDWTNWDKVNDLVITNQVFGVPVPLNWESAFIYEIGATRYFDNGLHLSAGYTFVENAVPNAEFTPLVPDADRNFINMGIGGQHEALTWQLTYQFSLSTKRSLKSAPTDPSFPINGTYDLKSQAIAASIAYQF